MSYPSRRGLLLALFFLCLHQAGAQEEEALANLKSFADPARIWGPGIESQIEAAYRQCFRTYVLGEEVMNLRMPFAQNNERDKLVDQGWEFLGGGKADPAYLWDVIKTALEGEDFQAYMAALGDGREKVVIFDIPGKTWSLSRDLFDIARMKAGAYRGLPHRPYVLVSGRGLTPEDVYNYLYCVGWVGMDCSGFVWHVLSSVARQAGIDLNRRLRSSLKLPRGQRDTSSYVGTWFFSSESPEILPVADEIKSLMPGDILLFPGADGTMVHSAIIQSVDFAAGRVRYLQCTDEAPPAERGVHESFIIFDPARSGGSLRDPALIWTQARYPPFAGEKASPFSDDGERFRAYDGGRAVRLKLMAAVLGELRRR